MSGIDLGDDVLTANDSGDGDAGANNLQNWPVLTSASGSGSSTTIQGTLNSAPNTQYRIEFFITADFNPLSNGQGQTFIGSTMVTTDGSGDATFNVTFPVATSACPAVTATATDPAGNTSEFSQGSCSFVLSAGSQSFYVDGRERQHRLGGGRRMLLDRH